MAEQTKRCGKCGKTKPREEFSKRSASRDGLQSKCKACVAEYERANRGKIAERMRAYYRANREARAAYYRANRERIAEVKREYRAANAEKVAERMRESLARSRGHYRWRYRKYHGTEPDHVEMFTLADVIERYGAKCWHCKVGEFEELDHYPVSVKDGGPHSLENVKPSCSACNRQTWREEIGDAA